MSTTPTFKKIKKNGTTLYVFPSVQEDKNFETQNENYKMNISHFAAVKFPRQSTTKLNFGDSFDTSNVTTAATFNDQLVESLRNYVANHECVVRNSMMTVDTQYYDVFENYTVTEKVFWKWALKTGIIDFELATNSEYPMNDPMYNPLGTTSEHQREFLWTERNNIIYSPSSAPTYLTGDTFRVEFTHSTNFKVGDKSILNIPDPNTMLDFTIVEITSVTTDVSLNPNPLSTTFYNNVIEISTPYNDGVWPAAYLNFDISLIYDRFVNFMSEITGVNNVQLPDRTYTEAYAYIAHQQGQIPYILWRTMADENYKPNSQFPILGSQLQSEIIGGENPNNPILTNQGQYPGGIWAQFDNGLTYTTSTGNTNKRSGAYFGNYNSTVNTGINPATDFSLSKFASKQFNSTTNQMEYIDGLTIDFDINHYSKANSYLFPIETFKEFTATSFDEIAPKDFEFNAILWFYTIEDVTGNNVEYATNLYGIEFINSADHDIDPTKTFIPVDEKYVTNGYQDGNSYTFSLDTNISIESYTDYPTFDPTKVYSLFGMELYYEALTRVTYMNDKLTQIVSNHSNLRNELLTLRGLIYTQENVDSIRSRMENIERLLTVYSTLQIGPSDTIIPELDTTVNPALIRLNSVDKRYGRILHYNTTDMFNEFQNGLSLTQITAVDKTIPVTNGKDFLVVINNNDNHMPTPVYDNTIIQDKLSIIIDKDLDFKQSLDIFILPHKNNTDVLNNVEPINDKELNLYINYDDGQAVTPVLLKTLALPVTTYHNGSTFEVDNGAKFESVPEWTVDSVWYSNANNNNISKLIFKINDDLTKNPMLLKHSRVLLTNLFLNINPTTPLDIDTQFIDLSKQYALSEDIVTRTITFSNISLINPGADYSAPQVQVQLEVSPGNWESIGFGYPIINGGLITGITMFGDATLYGEDTINAFMSLVTTEQKPLMRLYDSSATTYAYLQYSYKASSEISIDINSIVNTQEIISMLTSYNTLLTSVSSSYGSINLDMMCIDHHIKVKPKLTFLKGTKISITRISDSTIVPANEIDIRYSIKINTL